VNGRLLKMTVDTYTVDFTGDPDDAAITRALNDCAFTLRYCPCSVRELLPRPAKSEQTHRYELDCFVGLRWLGLF
jgi:hypothetical protein